MLGMYFFWMAMIAFSTFNRKTWKDSIRNCVIFLAGMIAPMIPWAIYFGVNEAILQNKADSEMLDAFFNGAIEPFSIQLSEVLTRMIFSKRERRQGNAVFATANRLQYMSVSQKVSMAKELGDRGAIYIDEIRELFNYPPLPNGDCQHAPLRGEYKFVDDEANNSGE